MNIRVAVVRGNINAVRRLIHKKNERDVHTGVTPLMIAAFHGHTPIVRLLINAGVNVNAQTPIGTTALEMALNWGRHNVVRNLIMAGANFSRYSTRRYPQALRNTINKARRDRKAEIQKILLKKVLEGKLNRNQFKNILNLSR
jgi:ankyrin repeat protein